mgnify:CR=1 FL=1
MTEQQIQAKRIKQLEDEGYYVIKLIKTNKKLQEYRLKELDKHGCKTEVYRG